MNSTDKLRVALVYDRVNKWGGAERLLLALHRIFPDAPLYTSVYNRTSARWADCFEIRTSFLQKLPFLRNLHEFIPFLMPFAFESLNLHEFDLVISVTSAEAKGIITQPGTLHICYCLTPTRYLYLNTQSYFSGLVGTTIEKLKHPLLAPVKYWDQVAKERPDIYLSISELVRNRVKKYYNRTSEVVYPPLDPRFDQKDLHNSSAGDYYLIVTRLIRYKRVDIAISAANRKSIPLKIVGVGREMARLQKLAGPTVQFLGFQDEQALTKLYLGARAIIVPGEEDFCLTSLEAQALGKAVIAYRHSGVKESVIEGKTGFLFPKQTPESLLGAVETFENTAVNANDCYKNSQKFNYEKFESRLVTVINKYLSNYGKSKII